MMPGEGIGPEMMDYVKDAYKTAGVPVDFGKAFWNNKSKRLWHGFLLFFFMLEMIYLDPTTDNYDDLYNVS